MVAKKTESKWKPFKTTRFIDLCGQWTADGTDVSLLGAPDRIISVDDGINKLEQTEKYGLSNMVFHVPYEDIKVSFKMRLNPEGQESKFNFFNAHRDTASRIDFFGTHRPGAVRISLEDEPFEKENEFDLTGIDFTKWCKVKIKYAKAVLTLTISNKNKTFEKSYPTGKSFDGFFGFGSYRGAAQFDNIKVKVSEKSFLPQPVKNVFVACVDEKTQEKVVQFVESFCVITENKKLFPALEADIAGLNTAQATELFSQLDKSCAALFVVEDELPAEFLVCAGYAAKSRIPVQFICKDKTQSEYFKNFDFKTTTASGSKITTALKSILKKLI